MSVPRFARVGAVAGTALLALSVAACGSSGGSGSGSSTQGISGKTITIGESAVLTGPESPYSEITQAETAYFNYINSQGGVNGYTFKIDQKDNAYQSSQSASVARTLAFQDKVFAETVVGTTPAQAVMPIASQLKIPVIFDASADVVKSNFPNVYGIEPSFSRQSLFDANYALTTLKTTKLAYAYENDDIGQPALGALPTYVTSHGGTLTTVGFPATATDYSSYANKLKASGAQTVIVFAGPPNLAGLQKAALAIGYKPKWIALFASVTPAYVTLAGPSAEGTYFDNFLETTTSSTASMQLFKQVLNPVSPSLIGLLGELGWTNASLVVEGVRVATNGGKTLTAQSFEAALNTLNNQAVGVWPTATYSTTSHAGSTSAEMLEVENGSFVPVTGFSSLPALS